MITLFEPHKPAPVDEDLLTSSSGTAQLSVAAVENALGKIIRVLPEPIARSTDAIRRVSARGPDPGARYVLRGLQALHVER